jgi:hypothetical protein
MTNEDDFVEKLLRDLPKAPPMNKLEIKRFEKHIDSLVAAEKPVTSKKGWNSKLSVAASVVALIAGIGIFANSSEILNSNNGSNPGIVLPTPGKTPTSVEPTVPATSGGSAESSKPEEGNSGSTVYGDGESPKPGSNRGSVPLLSNGFDYETDASVAKAKALKVATKGDFKLLKSSQIACSVKLGFDEELFAIDKGTYEGEDIEAYFYGVSKDSIRVAIVGFGCDLVTVLED